MAARRDEKIRITTIRVQSTNRSEGIPILRVRMPVPAQSTFRRCVANPLCESCLLRPVTKELKKC